MFGSFHNGLGEYDDFFGADCFVIDPERNDSAWIDAFDTANDFFYILRINVLSCDDDEIFDPAQNKKIAARQIAKVTGAVPAV